MARDYAARNRRPAARPAGLPGWAWLVAGLSMGLIVACIVYIGRPAQPMPMAPAASGHPAVASKPRPKIEIPPKEDPRFDFYTLLEKEQVVVPGESRPRPPAPAASAARRAESAAASASEAPTPPMEAAAPAPRAPAAGGGAQYLVLAGSFRDSANAEAHKAKLALAGVEAGIETISTQDHAILYRVRIGPSKSLEQAQGLSSRLTSQGFDNRVVKLP